MGSCSNEGCGGGFWNLRQPLAGFEAGGVEVQKRTQGSHWLGLGLEAGGNKATSVKLASRITIYRNSIL